GEGYGADDEQEVFGQLERHASHGAAELVGEVFEFAGVEFLQFGEAHAAESGEEVAEGEFEGSSLGGGQQHAHVADGGDEAFGVSGGDRDDEFLHASAEVVGHGAHHPEVDVGEGPAGVSAWGDEDVAGVGVCVEEPVVEELVEHGGGEGFGDGGGVDAGGFEAVAVADFDGGDVGEGEYASGRAFQHDGGCAHGGVVGEVV